MVDSLEDEIKKQNELFQQILDKGGLGVVIDGLEPAIPDRIAMNMYPYNYDKIKRQVSWGGGA